METFPRYLPFVGGIHRSPVFPLTKDQQRNFDVFFDISLSKLLNKHMNGRWDAMKLMETSP